MTLSLPPIRYILLSAFITLTLGLVTFTVTAVTTSGFLVWSDGLPYFLYARSAVLDLDTDITNEYDKLDAQYPADTKLMIQLRDWTRRDSQTGNITVDCGGDPAFDGIQIADIPSMEIALATLIGARPGPTSDMIRCQYFGKRHPVYLPG